MSLRAGVLGGLLVLGLLVGSWPGWIGTAHASQATGLPTISGTAQAGQTLTADTSGIDDADGLTNVSYSYQWIRSDAGTDTDISGETDSTYTVSGRRRGQDHPGTCELHRRRQQPGRPWTSAATAVVAPQADNAVPDEEATEEAVWSADMLVVEYTSVSIGAASSDLFSNIGGSAGLQIKSLWSYAPDRDLRLAFKEALPDTADLTLQVGDLALPFPAGSSGQDSFKWTGVDVDWEDGQTISVRIISTAAVDARPNSPATGAPTISGMAQVDQTLTSDVSSINDADGLTNVSYSYQWIRSDGGIDADIAGETAYTYTLVSADEGKTIKVRVSFTDDAGNNETLTSAATATVAAAANTPATGLPTISGTAQAGQTLTADTSGIADDDGLTNVSYSYQWVSNDGNADTDTEDATASTYEVSDDDVGRTIKVRVSFTDDRDNDESLTSAATAEVTARPNSPTTGAPTISGTAQAGQTLTADTSGIADDDGLDNVSYSYQWVSNDGNADTDIEDATASTYEVSDDDVGRTIKVRVSFTDDRDNDESLTSAATAAVTARPNSPATGAPTISGTAQAGQTLTADVSGIADTDGLDNVSYSYQWIRSDNGTDADIAGQTDSTYHSGGRRPG